VLTLLNKQHENRESYILLKGLKNDVQPVSDALFRRQLKEKKKEKNHEIAEQMQQHHQHSVCEACKFFSFSL
jgi:hypothetical protein